MDICQIVKAMLVTEIDVHGRIKQKNYIEKKIAKYQFSDLLYFVVMIIKAFEKYLFTLTCIIVS